MYNWYVDSPTNNPITYFIFFSLVTEALIIQSLVTYQISINKSISYDDWSVFLLRVVTGEKQLSFRLETPGGVKKRPLNKVVPEKFFKKLDLKSSFFNFFLFNL